MAFACLMYHSLSDGRHPDAMYPKYTTTRKLFEEHLSALTGEGYTLGAFSDLLARMDAGAALPERYCLLSFDDGHKSSLDLAESMLARGVTGTFFLTRDYCRDRADFLKPDEIRALAAQGFDFGAHGCTHRALGHLPPEQMRKELAESKQWLEDVLGRGVHTMSLPAGQGSEAVQKEAEAMGYRLVGNSREALNRVESTPAQINRFVVLAGYGPGLVCRLARGARSYIWKRKVRTALIWLPKRLLRSYDATRS